MFYDLLGRFLVNHRMAVLVALGVMTALAVSEAFDLRFNFTPQAIFANAEDGKAAYSEDFKAQFAYEDTVLLILLEAPPEGDVDALSKEALTWQYELTKRLETVESVTRVESIATAGLPRQKAGEFGVIETAPLVKELPVNDATVSEVRAALKTAKLVDGELISADRKMAAVAIFIDPSQREVEDLTRVVERVKAEVGRAPPPSGFTVGYAGIPELRTFIVGSLKRDQLRILPLAALVMGVLMALLFRSVAGVLLPLVAVGMGTAWLVVVMVFFDQPVNIVNNIIFVVIGIIGTADAVHIVSRYAEELHRYKGQREKAIIQTVHHVGLACLLTTATTAVGFFSLIVAQTDILQAFAWQAALGVGLVYVAVMLFLPATLPLMSPPRVPDPDGKLGVLERVIDAMASRVVRHPKVTLALGMALMVAAVAMAWDVKVDSRLMEVFEEDHPQYLLTKTVEEKLGGFLPVEISLKADKPQAFRDPDLYARVAALEDFAAQQPEVLHTRSYVDFHQEMRVAFIGDPAERSVLPPLNDKGRNQIYQMQELIDSAGKSLNFRSYMSGDFDHARVRVRVADVGSKETAALGERLNARMAELFPPETGVKPTVTGEAYVAAVGIDSFIRDLFYSLLGASVVIFAMMMILFRSVRTGLISVLPNVMPLVVTLGYLGWRGYDLNATNVILFSIGLGLAVDDTIHFLTRFREEVARSEDVPTAIRRSFHGAGRPIVITSVLLICGLLVLLASDFVPTRRFAELTAVTIFSALWGDLLVLPACLVLFWKKPKAAKRAREDEVGAVEG